MSRRPWPTVLDESAEGGHDHHDAECAAAEHQAALDALRRGEGGRLEGIAELGDDRATIDLGGTTVVAVLDRDLFGDELLRELNGTDADARIARPMVKPISGVYRLYLP